MHHNPKRLLFLAERYPPDLGGVATSAGRISRAIANLEIEVDVITWSRNLQPGIVVHEDSVYRMGRFREWDSTMPHTLNLFDWLTHERPYDAIWGHYLAPAGFLAAWFGKLKNIPATVSIRGNDLDRDMYPPGDFARLMWTLENAASISAVTKDLAAKVAALCGRRDVICLSNAVDSEAFQPIADESYKADLRDKLGIAPDEVVLGFAGELREKKGLQFLLDALRRVRETRPACLLIIGEVRPSEMPRLMFGEHRVVVTGQLATTEEVNRHLQLSDVYLQPSLWDGMPNAMLEAMAAGCFCIGSDAGGIPEIITNGIDGIIVPRWELHRLGDIVLEWLPRDTSAIRKAARERVVSGFHFELERRQLQQILELTVR